mmetsp:Transcript_17805/g.23048  ORF Transcript_17805/g.23048 Transcript_17805/m.23048 type:complete len:91 (-) Transcript_17805:80-352(-)
MFLRTIPLRLRLLALECGCGSFTELGMIWALFMDTVMLGIIKNLFELNRYMQRMNESTYPLAVRVHLLTRVEGGGGKRKRLCLKKEKKPS